VLADWEKNNVKVDFKLTKQIQDLDARLQDVQQHIMHVHNDERWSKLCTQFSDVVAGVQEVSWVHTTIASLKYECMELRHEAIKDAYTRTFDWIYHSPSSPTLDPRSQVGYVKWLQSGDGVYWVTGKPGKLSLATKCSKTNPSHVQALVNLL